MKKILLFSLGAALALTSCTKNEGETPSLESDVTFTSSIETALTRVSATAFEDGDAISVFANSGASYIANNVKYVSSGDIFHSTTPIATGGNALSYVAVYPYASDMALSSTFEVAADQTTEAAYEASDVLSAITSSTKESCPELTFSHAFSAIEINVKTDESVSSVVINAANNVTCDFAADNFTATGDVEAISPLSVDATSFKAIVAPQTVAAGSEFISLDIDGEPVVWKISNDIELESGYKYICEVLVTENGVSFDGNIVDWNDGGSIEGDINEEDRPEGDGYQGLVETVFVESGEFILGFDGEDCYDATPAHKVTLTKSFYIGKYELTQEEWNEVMGTTPSHFEGENLPVECVNWYDAVNFCNALSVKEGFDCYYNIDGTTVTLVDGANGYRLPTEAEWEYAARGGKYSQGYTWAGSNTCSEVSWTYDNAEYRTHSVGELAPNELGLYDMSGNVFEWCWDLYEEYAEEDQVDPLSGGGAGTEPDHIVRSGCYNWGEYVCRVYDRARSASDNVWNNKGFRIARTHIDTK